MNKYEITYITAESVKDAPVKKEIEGLGGKIIGVREVGQRQLAFPIKKNKAGFYATVLFEIEPTKVLDLNAKLNLVPEIIRHLIITAKVAKIEIPKIEKPKKEIVIAPETLPAPAKIAEPETVKEAIEEVEAIEKTQDKEKIEEKETKPAKASTSDESESQPKSVGKVKEVKPKEVKEKIIPEKPSKISEEISEEELSAEDRLKALDKKLDELLKE